MVQLQSNVNKAKSYAQKNGEFYPPHTNITLGFSLYEVILVLFLIGVISMIVIPIQAPLNDHLEVVQFFQQFEEDLYYIQQLAMVESEFVEIIFMPAHTQYLIRYRYGENLHLRVLPEGMSLYTNFDLNTLRFNRVGNINQGGRIRFDFQNGAGNQRKTYIFQVGSGRFYVE